MQIVRGPRPELRRFVDQLWAADVAPTPGPALRELMLPAPSAHLVVRVDSSPLEIFDDVKAASGTVFKGAALGGPRWKSYARSAPRRGRLVGAVLSPGSAAALFGFPATEFAGRHVGLEDILGAAAADELHDRVAEACDLDGALRSMEDLLLGLAAYAWPRPAAVTHALARFTTADTVRGVVQETGYSHRRFNDLFRHAVGLTPKVYCRLGRLNRLVARLGAQPEASLAVAAAELGYSDQAHMSRDFRDLTGLTLTEYRLSGAAGSRHVRID